MTDQGPGIPENKLEAIFERFYSERPKEEKFGTHSGLDLVEFDLLIDIFLQLKQGVLKTSRSLNIILDLSHSRKILF